MATDAPRVKKRIIQYFLGSSRIHNYDSYYNNIMMCLSYRIRYDNIIVIIMIIIIIAIIMIDTIIQRRDSRGQKVLIKICLRRTVPYPRENKPILNKRPSPLLLRSSCTRVFSLDYKPTQNKKLSMRSS